MEEEIIKGQIGEAPKEVINNNTSLRHDMMDVYTQLREGKISLRQAKEIANMAGKAIASAKAQLDYNVAVGSADRKIDFFED